MADRDRRPTRPRLSRERWEDGALEAIAEEGLSGLAIEPLARRLGVTKGSFYWHFDDRESLLEAALSRWERRSVDAIVDRLAGESSPRKLLTELLGAAIEEAHYGQLELIFGAAVEHPMIGPCLERVQGRRLALFVELFVALGAAPAVAERHALLSCAAQMGLCHMLRVDPSRRAMALEALVSQMLDALAPGSRHGSPITPK
jgi:AcrR family transcriptional regulator